MPVQISADATARPAPLRLARSTGRIQIASTPEGAAFELLAEGRVVHSGTTPATVPNLPTGAYEVRARSEGREERGQCDVQRGETAHVALAFATGRIAVKSDPPGAQVAIDGQPARPAPFEVSLTEGPHEFVATYRQWPEQRRTQKAERATPHEVAFSFPRGSVKITSAPSGAMVLDGERELGPTPLLLQDLEPGKVQYALRLEGFNNLEVHGTVQPGGQTFLAERFIKRAGPARGEPWENSLGMKFVPLGDVLMGAWPARVRDYDAFCAATGRARSVADFLQDDTHPVVKVNWDDAIAFCEWLTKTELEAGQLDTQQLYRLPTDLEWSRAVGLADEGGATPEERDGKLPGFPWGAQWPPPAGAGNFADGPHKRVATVIPGYSDGFTWTSPVGSFPANALGLHDLAGNVWQWCLEPYRNGVRWGVVRGGSWSNAAPAELRSSYRNVIDRSERDVIYGFRCVLVPER
jgi:formylglycine-generating enzyme required for sulfatase activity